MERKLKVVQYGLGPIGVATAKVVVQKDGLDLVGAIDIDPQKVGRDVGELLELGTELGVAVSADAEETLRQRKPDVVLHTTSSFLVKVKEQLEICIRAGANVVSSCEELFYPFDRDPEFSRQIDSLAQQHNVSVFGTGVNPGFAMDVLPVCLTGMCISVDRVTATRVVDASKRRLPLQRKIGAGMTPEAFRERVAAGGFGHIGLVESLRVVAAALGWPLERIDEQIEPMVAARPVQTPFLSVEVGEVTGIKHTARGIVDGQEKVVLDLRMYVGAEDPRDEVAIEGDPPIHNIVAGGIFGDTATVSALINAIPLVIDARPGLRTALDLPVPRAFL